MKDRMVSAPQIPAPRGVSIRSLTLTQRLLASRFSLASRRSPALLALFPIYPPTAWAKICYLAVFAIRSKRYAAATAVPDQPMAEIRPICSWHEAHEILLDLFRFSPLGKTEPMS